MLSVYEHQEIFLHDLACRVSFGSGREYFLDFDNFPWFRRATLEQLFRADLLHGEHLYWPELDVDLDLDRIQHPENYPLAARIEKQNEP